MSFRIGRKTAQYAYPQARATTTVPLARNSASGPSANTPIPGGFFAVTWNVRESVAGASAFVPITPKSTGIVHVTGVITLVSTGGPATIGLLVLGAPAPVPSAEAVTVAAGAAATLKFDVILGAGANTPPLTPGVPVSIRIRLTTTSPGQVHVVVTSSTISLQEVAPVTG